MSVRTRLAVQVFDAVTGSYLQKQTDELASGSPFDELVNDDESPREMAVEEVRQWLADQPDYDEQRDSIAARWIAAAEDPTIMSWPGGFTPADEFPLMVVSRG